MVEAYSLVEELQDCHYNSVTLDLWNSHPDIISGFSSAVFFATFIFSLWCLYLVSFDYQDGSRARAGSEINSCQIKPSKHSILSKETTQTILLSFPPLPPPPPPSLPASSSLRSYRAVLFGPPCITVIALIQESGNIWKNLFVIRHFYFHVSLDSLVCFMKESILWPYW